MGKSIIAAVVVLSVVLTGCQDSHQHRHAEAPHVCPGDSDMPTVYCTQCGVAPGEVTNCPRYSKHNFKSAPPKSRVVCKQCGIHPTNEPTTCPRYSSHNFMIANPDTALVCTQCGLAPTGKPVSCPRYSSHNFKVFE